MVGEYVGASFEVLLANDRAEVTHLAATLEEFGARTGLAPEIVYPVNLALDEILTKILSFGFPDGRPFFCRVKVAHEDGALKVVVEDGGIPHDPLFQAQAPGLALGDDEQASAGLGAFFVNALLDEVNYERSATLNRITLLKRTAAELG